MVMKNQGSAVESNAKEGINKNPISIENDFFGKCNTVNISI